MYPLKITILHDAPPQKYFSGRYAGDTCRFFVLVIARDLLVHWVPVDFVNYAGDSRVYSCRRDSFLIFAGPSDVAADVWLRRDRCAQAAAAGRTVSFFRSDNYFFCPESFWLSRINVSVQKHVRRPESRH